MKSFLQLIKTLACESIKAIKPHVFAKGGDKFSYEIPEAAVCRELGIEIRNSLGDKIQSSSDLVKKQKKIVKK